MSLLLKPNSVDAVDEESQNHEPEHDLAGQNIETDENKMAALSLKLIEEIVNSTDNLPDQIIEAAKAISKISSGINWIQNHKEDFERIIGRASILVIVLWKSYKKSKSPVWPTAKLRIVVDYLIETVHRIHKLLERKFKNFAKRIFGAYVVRDLGKFKKYEERLDSVAEDLETLCNIKINEVLLEVLDSQALSEQSSRGNLLDKEDTQTRAASQELLAEGSNSQDKAKSKALEKTKNKKTTMDEEGTSGQGFATTKPKKRLTQLEISVDEEPVSVPKMGPTKEKRPTMTPGQNVRRQTAPPQLGMLTSGFSINNYGSGTVANSDLGNIKDSIISNVGNNNSTNHFQRRPKKTRTGYGY